METLRMTTDSDWITTIWIDVPAKGVNTLSPRVMAELNVALDQVERDGPHGLIFASGKNRSFIAGADLFEIRKMDREQMAQFLAEGQSLFSRIANLPMPTVAAINGDCLGGGLELSLACSMRIAAADTSIAIGLPEVKLGILPGWGGTVRLPRLIGLTRALPLLLAGKTMPPKKALRAGIVDEVVRPEALLAAAKRRVMGERPNRRLSLMDHTAARMPFVRNKILARARRETLATTLGHYPAPMRLIDVVQIACRDGEMAGFDAERAAVIDLMQTDTCQNLIRLFFLKQGAKRLIADQLRARPAEVKRAAVIGGGTMGAGIVHALARAGIDVRLVEVNAKAASAGLARVKRLLDDDVSAGRLDRVAARNAMNRVAPCTDWTGLHLADVVIEAVLEEMPAKKEVFAKLDRLTRPDAVLATNTSSLSVTEIASSTAHPERVIGLHFFNPVAKMPLVEVVRTVQSREEPLATAATLAGRLGKTPVLVRDAPGFLVNRVLIPYLAEALAVAGEGVPIDRIDAALKQWGMPMGPFELLDTIGLDVAAHVLATLGSVLRNPPPMPPALQLALERRWLGDKAGRGFYEHDAKHAHGHPLTVNAELQQALMASAPPDGQPPASPSPSGSFPSKMRVDNVGRDLSRRAFCKTTGHGGMNPALQETDPQIQMECPSSTLGEGRRGGFPEGLQNSQITQEPASVQRPDTATSHRQENEAIAWRLVLPMVNEAARVLQENVTDSTETIDLATVLGLGLAPFRGGLIQFANAVGLPLVIEKLEALEKQFGSRFAPAALLRECATRNQPLSAGPSSGNTISNPRLAAMRSGTRTEPVEGRAVL